MKKALYFFAMIILTVIMLCCNIFTAAANETHLPTLIDVKIEDEIGVRYMIKSFEAAPWQEINISMLIEEPFEFEGDIFIFQYASIYEVTTTESKWERDEVSFPVDNDDLHAVFQRLDHAIPYHDEEGFAGKLELDYTAVWIQVTGYTNRRVPLTDTVTMPGLASNDTENIPKTRVRNGVTLNLDRVEWSVQEYTVVGFDRVPFRYTAVAHYAGSTTQRVPEGRLARAWYGGVVERANIERIVYTIVYAAILPITAEYIPETGTTTETEHEQTAGHAPDYTTSLNPDLSGFESDSDSEFLSESENENDIVNSDISENGEDGKTPAENRMSWVLPLLLLLLLMLGGGFYAYHVYRCNAFIYIRSGAKDKLLARRYIHPGKSVLDVRRLRLKEGILKICIKENATSLLHGCEVQAIARDDVTSSFFVKKKNRDINFFVTIPPIVTDGEDDEDFDSDHEE